MRDALLALDAREGQPRTATAGALERRRLIRWERTEQYTGWVLTAKGGFAVAWWRAQAAKEPTG